MIVFFVWRRRREAYCFAIRPACPPKLFEFRYRTAQHLPTKQSGGLFCYTANAPLEFKSLLFYAPLKDCAWQFELAVNRIKSTACRRGHLFLWRFWHTLHLTNRTSQKLVLLGCRAAVNRNKSTSCRRGHSSLWRFWHRFRLTNHTSLLSYSWVVTHRALALEFKSLPQKQKKTIKW